MVAKSVKNHSLSLSDSPSLRGSILSARNMRAIRTTATPTMHIILVAIDLFPFFLRLTAERAEDSRYNSGPNDARDVRSHGLHENEVRGIFIERDLV